MDLIFFGEGWLGKLLDAPVVPNEIKGMVRDRLTERESSASPGLQREWKAIDRLLGRGKIGEALERAMAAVSGSVQDLREALGERSAALEKPFSPFLVKEREIRRILHPREDIHELAHSEDELDTLTALQMINDARRLLASWGARVWGRRPAKLISRLEDDLRELRRMQAELADEEAYEEENLQRQMKMADRLATMATRFARDLYELHLLNARNREVRLRFELLWKQVEQLLDEGNVKAASQEAYHILEEAFQTAGLAGGDLLEMVDILYESFTDPEDLRTTVDRLAASRRDRDLALTPDEERESVTSIHTALEDMGLLEGPS